MPGIPLQQTVAPTGTAPPSNGLHHHTRNASLYSHYFAPLPPLSTRLSATTLLQGSSFKKYPFFFFVPVYAVNRCIERTKTPIHSPWLSNDAMSKNEHSRSGSFFFEWYRQDRFFGKDSNRPIIKIIWVYPLGRDHILGWSRHDIQNFIRENCCDIIQTVFV